MIREASAYFNIGAKKMRRMAEDNEGGMAYGANGLDTGQIFTGLYD